MTASTNIRVIVERTIHLSDGISNAGCQYTWLGGQAENNTVRKEGIEIVVAAGVVGVRLGAYRCRESSTCRRHWLRRSGGRSCGCRARIARRNGLRMSELRVICAAIACGRSGDSSADQRIVIYLSRLVLGRCRCCRHQLACGVCGVWGGTESLSGYRRHWLRRNSFRDEVARHLSLV